MICEGVADSTDPGLTPDEIARVDGLCNYLLGERLPCDIVDENNAVRFPKNRMITRNFIKIMVLEALEFGHKFKTSPQMKKVDMLLDGVLHGDDPSGKKARSGAKLRVDPNYTPGDV